MPAQFPARVSSAHRSRSPFIQCPLEADALIRDLAALASHHEEAQDAKSDLQPWEVRRHAKALSAQLMLQRLLDQLPRMRVIS
jgi:hypothetical protein